MNFVVRVPSEALRSAPTSTNHLLLRRVAGHPGDWHKWARPTPGEPTDDFNTILTALEAGHCPYCGRDLQRVEYLGEMYARCFRCMGDTAIRTYTCREDETFSGFKRGEQVIQWICLGNI